MGLADDLARATHDRGGQHHQLGPTLAQLSPEDAADLLDILASDAQVNWTALETLLMERGVDPPPVRGTLRNWARDVKSGRWKPPDG